MRKPTTYPLELAFRFVFPDAIITRNEGKLSLLGSEDSAVASELANLFGYKIVNAEVASDVLIFEVASDEDYDDYEDDDEIDEEIVDDVDSAIDDATESVGEPTSIARPRRDAGEGDLVVLRTPESHRFASKVFTTMLGNFKDMSGYPKFLLAFDEFLSSYAAEGFDPFGEEETDEVDTSDRRKPRRKLNELSALISQDTLSEVAKGKGNSRSQMLSAIMHAISDSGLQQAWDSKDADAFIAAMNDVAKKAAESL